MAGLMNRLKEAAFKAGQTAQDDPRLQKAAHTIKDTVESFKKGYQQGTKQENRKLVCPHCRRFLPPKANFCPYCGAKVD